MSKPIFNAHTHVFDFKCVPDHMSDKWYLKWVSINKALSIGIGKRIASWFSGNMRASKINRALNFVGIGMNSNQEEIFNLLQQTYKDIGDVRFVVLPMDMEFMEGGTVWKPYAQQLDDLVRLRSRYPDKMLPFLGIHPDRFKSSAETLQYVKRYIGPDKAFIGIKLYPATGYYPDDPRLMDMYAFAQDNQIPITTHCTKGPTHYLGKIPRYDPAAPDPKFYHPLYFSTGKQYYLNTTKPDDFQENWSQPYIFRECVLSRFKDLKINFAHFGGAKRMVAYYKDVANAPAANWYKIIRDMLTDNEKYPNVYTDISYTLTIDNAIDYLINKDIKDTAINDRILFGTDFYVVAVEKGESVIKSQFMTKLNSPELFEKIASDNAVRFLSSKFFTPRQS